MTKMTAGTGFSLNYAYDALKRSSGVTIKKANGSELFTRSYSYWDYTGDNTRTTSRLKTYENTDANGNLMTGYRYTYDVNGNITKIEEAYTANSYRDLAVYAYDDLNQLDSETRYSYTDASATPATTTVVDYSIDTAGNLRSVSGGAHSISYTYSDSSWADLLTGITVDGTSRTISYSSAGNPDNWYNGTDYTNLVWEQGRRLSSVTKHMTDGTRTYDYAYDMSGVRSSKTIEIVVDGVLRHRRYDYVTQNGKVVRETAYYTDGAGEFMHCMDFFYDEKGNPFAMRKYSDETLSNFNNYYYVLNAQGDVVKLIAPSGSVYAEYTYDTWGNILASSGSLRNTNPLRYRGYYYDKETGFYYLQSRYYDPIVKRFINADAYGSTGQGFLGYNMFAYCNNKPVISVDPTGETFVNAVEDQIPDVGGVCISLGLLGWISSLFLGNDVVVTDRVSSPAASSPSVSSQSNIVVEGASSAGPHSLSSVQIQANSVQAVSPKKPINLPSTKKVKIDMAHILSGHSAGGNRGPNKDRFPPWMTAKMIEQAIRMAYNNAEKGGPLQLSWQDGEEIIRQFYKGPWTEGTIEFWFNYSKKTIETAWPK